MTGAPVPEGADAVVPVEQTELTSGGIVRLLQIEWQPGQNILARGSSMRAGEVVVRKGTLLRPIEIGILAEVGRAMLSVQPRPRVAVLPTGDELVQVGERPAAGQIRNSNGPMLVAAAARAGADGFELPVAHDDRDSLSQLVREGLEADVLLLSGGVSAGKFDLVPDVLAKAGVKPRFHKISLRPGKPLWFGVKRNGASRVLVFGLPGNPVSSFVCFELFVRPALAALTGRGFAAANAISAQLSHSYSHRGGRAACLPGRLTWEHEPQRMIDDPNIRSRMAGGLPIVEILPWHGSADMATLVRANCLVRLPAEPLALAARIPIEVLPI
jgi:molybdopterin molybdotransferase